jgi:hypothetical protein
VTLRPSSLAIRISAAMWRGAGGASRHLSSVAASGAGTWVRSSRFTTVRNAASKSAAVEVGGGPTFDDPEAVDVVTTRG